MPTYLCHGFRWHRRDIRVFVFENDLGDVAPDWIVGVDSAIHLLECLQKRFHFLPDPLPLDTPYERVQTPVHVSDKPTAEGTQQPPPPLHHDDDLTMRPTLVPEDEDPIRGHVWSSVRLLEEFSFDYTKGVCRPYAYVADHVVRVDLGADLAAEMERYKKVRSECRVKESTDAEDKRPWIEQLRDKLQKEEEIKWYVVVCDDLQRVIDEAESDEDGDGTPPVSDKVPLRLAGP